MGADKEKDSLSNWIMAIAILIIIIFTMVYGYFNSSEKLAEKTITDSICLKLEDFSISFQKELDVAYTRGEGAAALATDYYKKKPAIWRTIMEGLFEKSEAYLVVSSDINGVGINQHGDAVILSQLSYFQKLYDRTENYFYLQDDGVFGKPAILIRTSIEEDGYITGYILQYFDVSLFEKHLNQIAFDGTACFMLIRQDGQKIYGSGNTYSLFMNHEDNFFTQIDETATGRDVSTNIKNRIINQYTGSFSATLEEEERYFYYVPVANTYFTIVAGVEKDYIEQFQDNTWKASKEIIIKLLLVLLVFFFLVVMVIVVNRLRFVEENRNLENMAETDLLTDLCNKVATEKKIMSYIKKNSGKGGVLFVLDIDNFKKINDTMGHSFGDEVLRTFGHDVRSLFRISDVLGRAGGDEFIIFLKDITELEIFVKEAKKITLFFRDFKVGSYVKYSATASIGAAVFPQDGTDFESLYKAADHALYKAKKRGKNQLAFFDEEIDAFYQASIGKSVQEMKLPSASCLK